MKNKLLLSVCCLSVCCSPPPLYSETNWKEDLQSNKESINNSNKIYFLLRVRKKDFLLYISQNPLQSHPQTFWDFCSSWSCIEWWSGDMWHVPLPLQGLVISYPDWLACIFPAIYRQNRALASVPAGPPLFYLKQAILRASSALMKYTVLF